MGIAKIIKKVLNVDGIEISISTDQEAYSQNDNVSGIVTIRNGENHLHGDGLKVELLEFWTEITGATAAGARVTKKNYKTHQESQLCEKFSIPPQARESYPFEVKLPRNCRISKELTIFGASFDEGWRLKVILNLPLAVNPFEKIELNVEPADALLTVVQACQSELHFVEKAGNRQWNESTKQMHFHFAPPDYLQSAIDYIVIAAQHNEDASVSGSLLIDLQRKSFFLWFKKFFRGYHVKRDFMLRREQLYFATGEPNKKQIAEVISENINLEKGM